jgi:hypothetical protein
MTELPEPGDVLHDARDEQPAAHETKDPEHRFAALSPMAIGEGRRHAKPAALY